jgi:hypothetical protein
MSCGSHRDDYARKKHRPVCRLPSLRASCIRTALRSLACTSPVRNFGAIEFPEDGKNGKFSKAWSSFCRIAKWNGPGMGGKHELYDRIR